MRGGPESMTAASWHLQSPLFKTAAQLPIN